MSTNDPGQACFIFYDAASADITEREVELLERAKHSLENALELFGQLRPETRKRFPLLVVGSYPPDPEYDGDTLSLEGTEDRLAAFVVLAESAQKNPAHLHADRTCLACLCRVYERIYGRPGVSLAGPFQRFVREAYERQGRPCPSADTVRRVAATRRR
jgi:hypothetical protein